MRGLILLFCALAAGCASGVIYAPAPDITVNPKEAALINGAYLPYGVYFTAVSQYDGHSARVVVLSYVGSKMLDMSVTPDEVRVYYKVPQLPARAVAAFGRFARAELFTFCPNKEIKYYDAKSRGMFEAEAAGGVQCPQKPL